MKSVLKLRSATIIPLVLAPLFSLAFAYVARSTFWQASSGFFAQVPAYALAVFLVQLPPFLFSELLLRRGTARKIGRGGWLIGWGAYEVVLGIFLVSVFSLPELWIGSVGLVYLGFGSAIVGLILRL